MEEEIFPNPNPHKDVLRYAHLVSSSNIDFNESQRYYREWAARYDQDMRDLRYRGSHYAVDLLLDYINNCIAELSSSSSGIGIAGTGSSRNNSHSTTATTTTSASTTSGGGGGSISSTSTTSSGNSTQQQQYHQFKRRHSSVSAQAPPLVAAPIASSNNNNSMQMEMLETASKKSAGSSNSNDEETTAAGAVGPPAVRIADVCCGTGLLVEQISQRLQPSAAATHQFKFDRKLKIDGIDASAAMLDHMPRHRRQMYNELVCGRVDVDYGAAAASDTCNTACNEAVVAAQNQNSSSIDYAELTESTASSKQLAGKRRQLDADTYDIVVACNAFALNHLDNRRGLEALCRLARAGGYVIIVMRAYGTSSEELNYYKQALQHMVQLERQGLWHRVWSSTALDIYDMSGARSSITSRRDSFQPNSNSVLRPAKLLVFCKTVLADYYKAAAANAELQQQQQLLQIQSMPAAAAATSSSSVAQEEEPQQSSSSSQVIREPQSSSNVNNTITTVVDVEQQVNKLSL